MSVRDVVVMHCDLCHAEASAPAGETGAFSSWMQLRAAKWLRFGCAVMPTDGDYCPKCAELIAVVFKVGGR